MQSINWSTRNRLNKHNSRWKGYRLTNFFSEKNNQWNSFLTHFLLRGIGSITVCSNLSHSLVVRLLKIQTYLYHPWRGSNSQKMLIGKCFEIQNTEFVHFGFIGSLSLYHTHPTISCNLIWNMLSLSFIVVIDNRGSQLVYSLKALKFTMFSNRLLIHITRWSGTN